MAAGSAGSVILDLGLNFAQFNRQLNGIAGTATNLVGGAFKQLGLIIGAAFAVQGITDFAREAINLASDLQEVQNVVDVTFGAMAADVNAFADSALESFGLSELSAKKYTSVMGAMLKSSGLTGDVVRDLSVDMTKLAADMASFYNLETDEAFDKIRSGIAGETEPLMALGVNMNVANMEAYALAQGITKSWTAMSQAEQVLLRYNYLLSVTGDAQGDFARNGDSWANQIRVLTEQWKIFQGTMGAGFINILTPVVKGLNWLIAKLQIAAAYFKAFTELIFGDATAGGMGAVTTATETAASGVGDVGTAATDTGKAVKKAGKAIKGSLGGFDQLNIISQGAAGALDDAAGAAGGIAAGLGAGTGFDMGAMTLEPDIDVDPIKDKVQAFVDQVKGMFGGLMTTFKGVGATLAAIFGPSLQTAWASIAPQLERIKQIFAGVFTDIVALGDPLKNWFVNDVIPLWQQNIEVMGHVVGGLMDSVLNVFQTIWDTVYPLINKFVTEGLPRYTEFVSGAIDIFKHLFDLAKQIFDDIWRGAVDPAMKIVSKIIMDIMDIIYKAWDQWGSKIVDKIKMALDGVKQLWTELWNGFLKPFVDEMLKMLSTAWDKHLKYMVEDLVNFVAKVVDGALDIYNKFILPVVSYMVKTLGPTFKNIFAFIGDVVGTAVGIISDVIRGIIKSLGGVIDFIVGVFTGNWKKAWNGIQDFSKGMCDALVGIFKGAINLIIDAVNFMIRQLNTVKIDVPDWVSKTTGVKDFGISIPTIPKLAKGGLAYGPTLAMVGDNKGAAADPEVISPLSKLQGMIDSSNQQSVQILGQILQVLKNSGNQTAVLQIGESEFGRVAAKSINRASQQAGRSLIDV